MEGVYKQRWGPLGKQGTPQSSVLGRLLYLIFSNEIILDNPYPFYSDAYDEYDIFSYETGPIWQDTWAIEEVNVICQK